MRRIKRAGLFSLFLLGIAAVLLGIFEPRAHLFWASRRFARPPGDVALPVEGLSARALKSSWHAPRSGGRRHKGIDLFAPKGTRVLSATQGVVWKVGTDSLGGRVVTVLGEGPALYYYAHLDDWAPGLAAGLEVTAGTALGTVGNSGNARATPPHLHFGVYRVGLWGARAVDPAPMLVSAAARQSSPGPRGCALR
jgi:murein DD-endopeptidase MepM/ murein hydrolase activator NlpD